MTEMDDWQPSQISADKIAFKTGQLTQKFSSYLAAFDQMIGDEKIFGGPGLYFHYTCISKFARVPMAEKLNRGTFYKYLYSVLASWGMYRTGSAVTDMQTPDEFQSQIMAQRDALLELEGYKIWALDEPDRQKVQSILAELLDTMLVAKTKLRLIANSKILHHILPDLVPPVDRMFTLPYFGIEESLVEIKSASSVFAQIYPCYVQVAHVHQEEIRKRINLDQENWYTSFTKVIDNAVVGASKE
jgi:hypothetical protein